MGGGLLDLALKGIALWIVLLFVIYEGSSFRLAYHECRLRQETNDRTLRMIGVCDSSQPLSAEMQNACIAAERENRVSAMVCAWRSMWTQGELLRVWHMFTESYLMLFGMTCAIFVCLTYFVTTLWTARQQRLLYREFVQQFAAIPQPQPLHAAPLSLPAAPVEVFERRKKFGILRNEQGANY